MEKSWKKFTSDKLVRSATWYSRDWGLFAYAFRQSADVLFENYKTTRRDVFWFPALFLYRQWVELALKSLWTEIYEVERSIGKIPHVHSFKKLWPPMRAWLVDRRFFLKDDQFVLSAERIFDELDTVDPDGTAFRYPPLKIPHPDIINFSIEDLETAIDEIDTVFVGLVAWIDEYKQSLVT